VSKPYVVYGQKGTGSVPVEATLLLLGEPYELVERAPTQKPEAGDHRRAHGLSLADHGRPGERRPRFYQEAPKMADVVRRLDQDPRLAAFWAERLG
jgi:hypothetical protein